MCVSLIFKLPNRSSCVSLSVSITTDRHHPRSPLSLVQAHNSFATPHRKQELEAEQLHPHRYSQHRPLSSPFVSPSRRRSPLLLSEIGCCPCIFAKLLSQPQSPQHGASAKPIHACSGCRSRPGAVFFLANEQSTAASTLNVGSLPRCTSVSHHVLNRLVVSSWSRWPSSFYPNLVRAAVLPLRHRAGRRQATLARAMLCHVHFLAFSTIDGCVWYQRTLW
jgi:hypothetical protein